MYMFNGINPILVHGNVPFLILKIHKQIAKANKKPVQMQIGKLYIGKDLKCI